MSIATIKFKTEKQKEEILQFAKEKGLDITIESNNKLTLSEKEDLGLLILMKKADRSKKVSRDKIMNGLKI